MIGSLYSGEVTLIRTRPVVTLKGHVTTSPQQLTLQDSYFTLTSCLHYDGKYVPQDLGTQLKNIFHTIKFIQQLLSVIFLLFHKNH